MNMLSPISSLFIFAMAAVAEIAGCFAFWAWLKQGHSVLFAVAGVFSLILFAYLLTLITSDFAGRAYAAYGGIYIIASLVWMWMVEGQRPDQWDMFGSGLAIVATLIILFAPHQT